MLEEEIIASETPFKHPRCGGVVLMVEDQGRLYYQCSECLAVADEVEVLAIGKPVIIRRSKRSNPRQDVES